MYVSSLLSWIDRAAMETQLYQLIHINGDTLTFEAYTTIGDLYDKFTITKKKNGQKQFRELVPANTPERLPEQFARELTEADWAQWVAQFEAYKARRQTKLQANTQEKSRKRRK
jgi:hypothetical protein